MGKTGAKTEGETGADNTKSKTVTGKMTDAILIWYYTRNIIGFI